MQAYTINKYFTIHNLAANEDAAAPVVFNKLLIRQLLMIHSQYLSNFQGHYFQFHFSQLLIHQTQ